MRTLPEIVFFRLEKIITSVIYPIFILKNHLLPNETSIILAYHNISHYPNQLDELMYLNLSPYFFQKQMQYLQRNNFNVISLEDFVLLCKNRERIPKKTVVLTFDDGYEGVYLNAYKVLKKFNFPATIFLSCASIGTKKTFPWLPFYETQLSNIPKQMNPWLPLSWQEVQEMSKNSVSFGSHTMTHPEMGNLPEKQIEWEISESKRTIENKIGNNIWLFSYPHSFSGAKIFDRTLLESIKKLLKANGFEAACSTEIGANSQKTDLFTLRRIQIDQTDSLFHFKAKVIGAYNWVRFPQQVFRSIFAFVERSRTFKKEKPGQR